MILSRSRVPSPASPEARTTRHASGSQAKGFSVTFTLGINFKRLSSTGIQTLSENTSGFWQNFLNGWKIYIGLEGEENERKCSEREHLCQSPLGSLLALFHSFLKATHVADSLLILPTLQTRHWSLGRLSESPQIVSLHRGDSKLAASLPISLL